jgi:ketosteroid isomerase-like protein
MSEENVELVRQSVEVWNRCDRATWVALFSSDGEVDWSRSRSPFKGVYRGHGEIASFWDVFWSNWEDVQLEAHDFTDAGSEVVLWNTAHMRGRQGIEVNARFAWLWSLHAGQIQRITFFEDADDAIEAAGLSE